LSTDCSAHPEYTTLKLSRPSDHVLEVQMNRPDRSNAMNRAFWAEIRECFQRVDDDADTRVVILSGAGKNFTGGRRCRRSVDGV
jgi:delta(3,5)-delta(2,4)-dienoyl-CoA isomerase